MRVFCPLLQYGTNRNIQGIVSPFMEQREHYQGILSTVMIEKENCQGFVSPLWEKENKGKG
jgi:hypothetical protein